MVAARSAAMAFNRWADAAIDAANPRTSTRALPAGHLSPAFVVTFVVVSSAIFILAASQLNRLSLLLSPVALAVLLLYSYTKRVTRWSHLVLGFALGIAPSAAWIAVRGSLDPRILLLTAAVTFWVGGFDVLYACQDFDFDRQAGLHSIPRYVGIPAALWIARSFHAHHGWIAGRPADRLRDGEDCRLRGSGRHPAAALRTFSGPARRSFETQCRFLHHERRHLGAVLRVRRGRLAPAEISGFDRRGSQTERHSSAKPPLRDSICKRAYGLTFNSSIVPLSTFTLFFSELNTDPCAAFAPGSSFRSEIPTTPCVLPVMGGRAPLCCCCGGPSMPSVFVLGAAVGGEL